MKCVRRNFAVLIGIPIALAVTATLAPAATSITTCPFVITAPGNYVVGADLDCLGDAIDIEASNVSVNLNGHILTNSASPSSFGGYGIVAFDLLNHVSVTGPGLVRGFINGVVFRNTDYSQMTLVTVMQSEGDGFQTEGDNTFLTLGSNVLANNRGSGIDLSTCINCVVQYNDASGNGDGIFLSPFVRSTTLNNNTASGNKEFGIGISGSLMRVYSNVTNGNGTYGIGVNGSQSNQVFNNSSSRGNGTFDLQDLDPTCSTNLWANNVFFTSKPSTCIR